jgi:cell wall-associated NlpC family hydrolase
VAAFVALTLTAASVSVGLPPSAASAAPQPGPSTTTPVTTPTTTPGVTPTPTLIPPPTDLANGIAQAARLRIAIDANSRRADILDEKYLEAQTAVRKANRQIAATQRKIDATNAKVASLKAELAGRAALLYIGAGNTDPIGFDATSVQELGARAKYGDAAAATDERLLDELKHTEDALNAQHDDLESQLAVAKQRQDTALAARRQVARVNANMQKLLATTSAGVRLLAAKMEQDALANAAIAEQAWLLRLAARKGPDFGIPIGDIPAPSPGALLAVAYAERQLGKPYVYAGAGPNVFDCSGLTMMAWRQAGVSMEHGSRSQWLSFPHVPIDQLAPGDLVFFGVSGPLNHHVGIVIGPGIMIEAPHTGAFVRIASYFRPDLVPVGARPTSPPGFTPKTSP